MCTYTTAWTEGTFVVPAGVSSVRVVADGGAGGSNVLGPAGGPGAQVTSDLSVMAGFSLFVEVDIGFGLAGHFGAGYGGGESDVRTCSIADSTCPAVGGPNDPRLSVAGGGGGGGATTAPVAAARVASDGQLQFRG